MGQRLERRDVLSLAGLALGAWALSRWWGDSHAAELGGRIASAAAPGDIQMLSSRTCASCVIARQWFKEHGIAFSECTIEDDAACAQRYTKALAAGTPTFIVRGQIQIGFAPERIALGLGLKV
jgi:glutaredoxin